MGHRSSRKESCCAEAKYHVTLSAEENLLQPRGGPHWHPWQRAEFQIIVSSGAASSVQSRLILSERMRFCHRVSVSVVKSSTFKANHEAAFV